MNAAQILLQNGSNKTILSYYNNTPSDLAREFWFGELAEYIDGLTHTSAGIATSNIDSASHFI